MSKALQLVNRALRRLDYRHVTELRQTDARAVAGTWYVIVYCNGAVLEAWRERPGGQLRKIASGKLPRRMQRPE